VEESEAVRLAYERQEVRWQDARYRSSAPGNLFILQELERTMVQLLHEAGLLPLDHRRILDVGCGHGKHLIRFLTRGARPENLHGIDIQEDLIATGRELAPHLDLRVADAMALPFDDGTFDLVTAYTMLSSMRSPDSRVRAAHEMLRVAAPGGGVLVYDFGFNPRNDDVQAVGAKELRRIFPCCRMQSRRITLAPPIARALAPRSWIACAALSTVRPLRTHRLTFISAPRQ
jgi:SAM-dependent methyltransferase